MDVILAARDGGRAQLEPLLRAVWPDAYRLARAILGESQGAEDAAQEACIKLCKTIASLRSPEAFRVWFYRIVVREASELKRRRARSEPLAEVDEPASTGDPVSAIDVWRALSTISQRQRNVVVLHYFEDLSSREIASVLGTTDGAVRFHLMMAKRRLRPLLDDNIVSVSNASSEVRTNAI